MPLNCYLPFSLFIAIFSDVSFYKVLILQLEDSTRFCTYRQGIQLFCGNVPVVHDVAGSGGHILRDRYCIVLKINCGSREVRV